MVSTFTIMELPAKWIVVYDQIRSAGLFNQ